MSKLKSKVFMTTEYITNSKIVTISGPSGVGKDTVIGHLENEFGFQKIVSFTTRPPRPGEQDGVSYHFISLKEFLDLENHGELLDHVIVANNHYGLSTNLITEQFSLNKQLALNVVVETARIIKTRYPNATLVFLKAPNMQCLIERLKNRGMCPNEIAKRYKENPRQLIPPEDFDLIVTNYDGQQKAVAETIAQHLKKTGYAV